MEVVPLEAEKLLASGRDGPVCALDDLARWQAGEEAVHAFLELGRVARDGAVDCVQGQAEFFAGGEAGGEAVCEGEEVVFFLGGGGEVFGGGRWGFRVGGDGARGEEEEVRVDVRGDEVEAG